MIVFTSLREVDHHDYDEVWMVVRSLKTKQPWMTHVPELSPNWSLFTWSQKMIKAGQFTHEVFNKKYRPEFMTQIMNDISAHDKLNELIAKSRAGKQIAVVCFCKDASLCHRSLLKEIVEAKMR